MLTEAGPLECSLCGKAEGAVAKVISGPGVNICDVCVDLCVEILQDEGFRPTSTHSGT